MSEQTAAVPRYMAQLLEELGWNQGTRIPLANPDNQNLEALLIDRYVSAFTQSWCTFLKALGCLCFFLVFHQP